MNEDKILYCLLSHKALKSESEKNIMDILSSNHIISGNAEKDYCLAQGLLVRVVAMLTMVLAASIPLCKHQCPLWGKWR